MAKQMEKMNIADEILAKLNEDPRVDAAQVIVEMPSRGRVNLRGTVANHLAKRAAEEAAKSVPGVRIVHNFILVTMEGVPQPDVAEFIQAETVGDEALTARINLLLLAQAVLQAERIDVLVEEGVATLDGSVNAFWKRNRAEELALSVDGVREVVNKLTIVPNGGAGDEEIAARIFDGLERNFLIDAQTVDVKVNDALVTLRGTVPSRLAKQEAFQIALGTEGVVDVRDELVIAAA